MKTESKGAIDLSEAEHDYDSALSNYHVARIILEKIGPLAPREIRYRATSQVDSARAKILKAKKRLDYIKQQIN